MEERTILKEVEGNIGIITLNRPDKKNMLSVDLLVELHKTLTDWAKTGEVRVLIIRGAGDKAFSSGFDILSIPTEMPPEMAEVLKDNNPLELALDTVKNFPCPAIAMLNGYTIGAGFNLALCCDLRIGADDIRMGMPPAKIGLVYHPEGIKQFVEVLGMAKTRELFFTAKIYSAEEVREMGLVDRQVPRDRLYDTTMELAGQIASNAPLSLKGMKRIINMVGNRMALGQQELEEAEALINEAFNSEDIKEGQAAFIQKRKPEFKGR